MDFTEMLKAGGDLLTKAEANLLYESALEIKAEKILEIGARAGCTSQVLATVAKQTGGHVQSLEKMPRDIWYRNIEAFEFDDYVDLIHGESPWIDPEIIDHPFDFLCIDGEHHTPECLVDYWYWSRYLRPGGRVAFHDWNGKKGVKEMVQKAIELIRERHTLIEVGRTEGWFGLIVFETPESEGDRS